MVANDSDSMFAALKKIVDLIQADEPCENCGGGGYLENKTDHYSMPVQCSTCKGSGKRGGGMIHDEPKKAKTNTGSKQRKGNSGMDAGRYEEGEANCNSNSGS